VHTQVIILFIAIIAIIAHKWAESFALGISFYNAGIQNKIFIKMHTIFTFFTPVGILKYLKFLFYLMGGLLTVLLNILEPAPMVT